MARAFVAFGGNLGPVEENLRGALTEIAALPRTRIRRVSSLFRTAPAGVVDQPDFINGVAELETELAPQALLSEFLRIESALGRIRDRRWGPRTVDLDLLLWGEETLATPSLEIPHPRMHERGFVLVPLAEIAPEARHPTLGSSILALREALGATPDVQPLGRPAWADDLERAST